MSKTDFVKQRELNTMQRLKFIDHILRDDHKQIMLALYEFGNFNKIYGHLRKEYEDLANFSISRDFFTLIFKYKVNKGVDDKKESFYYFDASSPFTVQEVCSNPTICIRKQYVPKRDERNKAKASEEVSNEEKEESDHASEDKNNEENLPSE